MSGPVRKKTAEARFLNRRASFVIHVFRRNPWPDFLDRSFLSFQHNLILSFKFGRDSTEDQQPRQVALIEPPCGTPVHNDRLTGRQGPEVWPGVTLGRMW